MRVTSQISQCTSCNSCSEEFTDVLFVIFCLCTSWGNSRMSNIAIKRVQREFKEKIGASANGEVGEFLFLWQC